MTIEMGRCTGCKKRKQVQFTLIRIGEPKAQKGFYSRPKLCQACRVQLRAAMTARPPERAQKRFAHRVISAGAFVPKAAA